MGVIAGQIVAAGKILDIIINLPLFLLMVIVAFIITSLTLVPFSFIIVIIGMTARILFPQIMKVQYRPWQLEVD